MLWLQARAVRWLVLMCELLTSGVRLQGAAVLRETRYVCMLGWGVRRKSSATLSGENRPGIITRPKRQPCKHRSPHRLCAVRPIDINGEYLVVGVEGGARRLETGQG